MKKNLENALRRHYDAGVPAPAREAVRQTVVMAKKEMSKITYTDGCISLWTFFGTQAGFIKKKVWFTQFFTVLLCGFVLLNNSGAQNTIGMISALLPFLFLAGMGELSRAFVYNTAEMELSTRFTLHQVMLSRIIILGLADVFFLTIIGAITLTCLSTNLLYVFMYLGVPFLITSFGCLFILNHVHTRECSYYCGAWGIGIVIISFCLTNWIPSLYEASLIWCWCLLFAAALLGVGFECLTLLGNCKKDVSKILITD